MDYDLTYSDIEKEQDYLDREEDHYEHPKD